MTIWRLFVPDEPNEPDDPDRPKKSFPVWAIVVIVLSSLLCLATCAYVRHLRKQRRELEQYGGVNDGDAYLQMSPRRHDGGYEGSQSLYENSSNESYTRD